MVVNSHLGPSLRQAWVGYRRRLDAELAAAGFDDHGFPDGRVLRLCLAAEGATSSDIARGLSISRQGASKHVASLRDRGYVTLSPSPRDRREKIVSLTPRAHEYLAAHHRAARTIERQLRAELGDKPFAALSLLLDALGEDGQPRLRDYLRRMSRFGDLE